MTSIVDKIRKRRCYPVAIENGETLHVRPMKWPDRFALNDIESVEDKIVFRLGCCIVEENGDQAFPISDSESVAQYISRIRGIALDLTYDDVVSLLESIAKVTKTPSVESIEKNFSATTGADS